MHDEGTFESFVAARSGALYRTAFLLTGQRSDAEDLLQVTLVKLYVAWSRARAAASTEAYARTVLAHAFVSSRRPRRFTRERLVESPPEHPAPQPAQQSPGSSRRCAPTSTATVAPTTCWSTSPPAR